MWLYIPSGCCLKCFSGCNLYSLAPRPLRTASIDPETLGLPMVLPRLWCLGELGRRNNAGIGKGGILQQEVCSPEWAMPLGGLWTLMSPTQCQVRAMGSLTWELTEGTVLVEGCVEDQGMVWK